MQKVYLSLPAVLFSVLSTAQEGSGKEVNVNINTEGGSWYTSPWIWVVGAAVFILLLVALTRGGGRKSE